MFNLIDEEAVKKGTPPQADSPGYYAPLYVLHVAFTYSVIKLCSFLYSLQTSPTSAWNPTIKSDFPSVDLLTSTFFINILGMAAYCSERSRLEWTQHSACELYHRFVQQYNDMLYLFTELQHWQGPLVIWFSCPAQAESLRDAWPGPCPHIFENLQEWRLCNISGQPVPVIITFTVKVLPDV